MEPVKGFDLDGVEPEFAVGIDVRVEGQGAVRREGQAQFGVGNCVSARAGDGEGDRLSGMAAQGFDEGLEVGGGLPVDGEDAVARLESSPFGAGGGHDPVDDGGEVDAERSGSLGDVVLAVDEDLAQFGREVEGGHLAVAQDFGRRHLAAEDEVLEVAGPGHGLSAEGQDDVPVLQAGVLERLGEGHAVGERVELEIPFTPDEEDKAVDQHAENEVDGDASEHDDEALPGGLGPELPRLRRLGHLLLVHALVNHAGDFDIAAEREPADAVHRFPDFLLPQGALDVEEEEELLDAGLEEARGDEVSEFVEHDQEREAQEELTGFDEDFHDAGDKTNPPSRAH